MAAALLLLATAHLRAGTPNGVVVDTLGGGGYFPFYGYVDGDTAAAAQFHTPIGLALDSTGNYLHVADRDNNAIRVLDLAAGQTFTLVPNAYSLPNAIASPVGVVLDADDNTYVLSRGNGTNGTVIEFDYYGDLVATNAVGLVNANAMAMDDAENIYVTAGNTLIQIRPGGVKTTVATVTAAGANLQGLVVMDSGMIAVCDSGRHGIYLINPLTHVIATNTGFNGVGDNLDQYNLGVNKAHAKFNQPYGLAKAGNDMLIVSDYGNNRVKVVNAVGTVTNLYGVSSSSWYTDPANPDVFPGWYDGSVFVPDGVGDVEAREPRGVLLASGAGAAVYVTEDYYHLIRKVTAKLPPVVLPPATPTILTVLANYGQVSLTWSTVAGTAMAYNVKRSPASGGPYTTLTNLSSAAYTDTNVINGTTYYYVVSAVSSGREGHDSEEVSAPVPLPPVPDPKIGYVDFPASSLPVAYTSVLHPVSSYVIYNDTLIAIKGTPGSGTYYTYGYTNKASQVDNPTTGSSAIPSDYQDGLFPSQVVPYTVAQVAPYLTIKALGAKDDGSPDSAVVTTIFQFKTGNPNINGINAAQFTISDITAKAHLYYTLDGSDPSSTNGFDLGTVATPTNVWTVGFTMATNTLLKIRAFRDHYLPSAIVSNVFLLSNFVPPSSIDPDSGYYPMGQSITVHSLNVGVYYTADGSEPTTNSSPITMSNNVGVIKWFNSTNDLRGLRVKAFIPGGASDVVAGQPATTNTIGVPTDFNRAIYAGIGAQMVVPVVVNLQAKSTIKSYQFRVEIAPNGNAQPIGPGFDVLNVSTNDFIPLATAGGSISVQQYTNGSAAGLVISAIGVNAGVSFQNFAVVALLRIAIPYGANEGDSYALTVSYPSATADGVSASVPLIPMAPATILVTNTVYKVGDTASIVGGWYNAGGFGDGDLNNSDVNLAFYAALGVRVPYAFSDVFNALDTYPVDATGFVGGDGQIRFLDWNVILQRSLRLDTNNWARAWSPGGNLVDVPTTLTAAKAKGIQPRSETNWPWYRQVLLGAVSTGNALPGRTVNVPAYVTLSDGAALSGLQFRVVVTPQGGAPALTQAPQFALALGVPGPTLQQSFDTSGAGFGWALGSFDYRSQSSNFLGWVTFTVPADARSAQTYAVSFANADGAPNLSVQYDFETRSAVVAVGGSAPPATLCSDEWRIHFFGSLTHPNAADLADADGEGVPNWREYLAGTDPTDPNSRLQLSGAASPAGKAQNQMALQWLTAPGKAYEVQWSSNLSGGSWSTLATVSGDGTAARCFDTNLTATVRYYRLRVLP